MRVVSIGGSGSFLGVGVRDMTAERAKELKLGEEAGVEITRVDADSPAAKAGLKETDTVLEYNGQRVEGIEQFVRLVRETPAGRNVKLKISRGGSQQMVTATIAERRGADRAKIEVEMDRVREKLRNMPEIRMPDMPNAIIGWRSGMIGIEGEGLSEQLAAFFGVKEGVLVRSVAKDMPAEKAGIKAGDVITKVDGTTVKSARDITSGIRNAKSKMPVKVTLVRNKAEMNLDVTVDTQEASPARRRAITVTSPQEFDFKFEL